MGVLCCVLGVLGLSLARVWDLRCGLTRANVPCRVPFFFSRIVDVEVGVGQRGCRSGRARRTASTTSARAPADTGRTAATTTLAITSPRLMGVEGLHAPWIIQDNRGMHSVSII